MAQILSKLFTFSLRGHLVIYFHLSLLLAFGPLFLQQVHLDTFYDLRCGVSLWFA